MLISKPFGMGNALVVISKAKQVLVLLAHEAPPAKKWAKFGSSDKI